MRFQLALSGLVCLLWAGIWVSAAPAADAVDTRARRMIENAGGAGVDWDQENNYKLAHCVVQAKFATGRDEEARRIIARALEAGPLVDYFDPEFPLWSTMDCYMRWKNAPGKYTPELKRRTKAYVAAAKVPSDATTYNHHWMLAAGLILAYQEWGDDISYVFEEDDPTGKKWAFDELERIARQGHSEELSPTYAKYTLGPILSLYHFCDDPQLKHRAGLTLDAMLIRRACGYFQGHTAGTIRRSYGQFAKANNDGGFMWLYVGGPENLGGPSSIGFALSDYRPPQVVAKIAHDRGKAFEQTASMMHNGIAEWRTTFYNKTYAVGSAYPRNNYLGRRSSSFHERLSWSVVWADDPAKVSSFLIKHPTPKYGFDKNRYLGDSPFHQVLQHRGTVIGLFDIPAKQPGFYKQESWRRLVLGGFPINAEAIIDESNRGRLYLDFGSALIALATTAPLKLEDDRRRGVRVFSIEPGADTFRVGYAVETASPDDYAGTPAERVEAWRRAAGARFDQLAATMEDGFPALEYSAVDGTRMKLGWRPIGRESVRLIDGAGVVPERHAEWPLIDNPWVRQSLGGDRLHIDIRGERLIYDFNTWEVRR